MCRNLHVVSDTILDTPVSALAALVTIFLRIPKPRARINSPPERRIARMSRLRERRGRRRRQGAKQPVDFGLCSDAAPAVDAGSLDGESRVDLPSVSPPFGTSHKPKDAVRERFFRTESPPKMAPVRLRGAPPALCKSRRRRSEAERRSAARHKARPYRRAAISLLVSLSASARTMRLHARDRGALVCGSEPSTPVARPRPKQSQRLAPPPFSPPLLIGEDVTDLPPGD